MALLGSSNLDVFPLNLGGNVFGWTADRDASFAILDAFVDGGGDFVDTADAYSAFHPGNSGGESETIIGEWLASRGRERLVVATKVSRHPEFLGLAPDNIRAAADASLKRLGTDHIDLYYGHFDDPQVPAAEFAGAFSELVDAGKVRTIGISNFSPERIDEWFAAVRADGLHAPVALQPQYNLVERDFETNGLRKAALHYDLAVLPYYALAKGFLTGKYRGAGKGSSPRAAGALAYLDDRGRRVLAALDEVAAAHGTKPAVVALAWLRQQGTIPIASASRVEQLADLLASAQLDLEAAEIEQLTAAGVE
ncbi:MAG: aldo/keto reductase [Marmoricola sp.]